jgi:hypothetical protein
MTGDQQAVPHEEKSIGAAQGQGSPPPSLPETQPLPSSPSAAAKPNPARNNTAEPEEKKKDGDHKLLPWYEIPEWIGVVIAALNTLIALFAVLAVVAQAIFMYFQTKFIGLTLDAIQTQVQIMVVQSKATEKQTKVLEDSVAVAQKSAEAALLNAKALAYSERPWLIVQIEEKPGGTAAMTRFSFHVYNHGNSPAYVTGRSDLEVIWLENPDAELPAIPTYKAANLERCLLLRTHKMFIGEVDPWADQVMQSSPRNPKMQLVVYGVIDYTDGVTETVHQTAFCYRRKRDKMSDMGGHLVLCGPSAYNKHT